MQDISNIVSDIQKLRLTIYLNNDRIKSLYDQIGGNDKISSSDETTGETSGGLPKWIAELAAKMGHKTVSSSEKQINTSPILMAYALENHLSTLGKLKSPPFYDKSLEWIKVSGRCHFMRPREIVSSEKTGLPVKAANIIQEEREIQESIIKLKDEKLFTFVWINKNPILASILCSQWIEHAEFASWATYPHRDFGIFGLLERECDYQDGDKYMNIKFIAPVWLWLELK